MLQPKKVKRRRVMKGRMRGKATRGEKLSFGDFGLKATARGRLTARQIEAARRAKQATAFDASREYIEAAAEIVPPDLWDTNYALAVEISTMRIELAFIGVCKLKQRSLLRTVTSQHTPSIRAAAPRSA